MAKPAIKLMPDYQCYPLWHYGGAQVGCIDPGDLGLSHQLVADLQAWAADYDSHLKWNDPASTHRTKEEEVAFDGRGRSLARRLAEELGSRIDVFYFDPQTRRCVPGNTV